MPEQLLDKMSVGNNRLHDTMFRYMSDDDKLLITRGWTVYGVFYDMRAAIFMELDRWQRNEHC